MIEINLANYERKDHPVSHRLRLVDNDTRYMKSFQENLGLLMPEYQPDITTFIKGRDVSIGILPQDQRVEDIGAIDLLITDLMMPNDQGGPDIFAGYRLVTHLLLNNSPHPMIITTGAQIRDSIANYFSKEVPTQMKMYNAFFCTRKSDEQGRSFKQPLTVSTIKQIWARAIHSERLLAIVNKEVLADPDLHYLPKLLNAYRFRKQVELTMDQRLSEIPMNFFEGTEES
jgi:CheY-like chemotaxis protein